MTRTDPASAWAAHLGGPIDIDAVRRDLAAGSIPSVAADTASRLPDKVALTVGPNSITFGALDDQAARVAGWLTARGVTAGERVLLAGPNSVDFAVAYLAILAAGATVVLVNPMLTARELAIVVDDSAPALAISSGERTQQLTDLAHVPALTFDDSGRTQLAEAAAGPRPSDRVVVDSHAVAHLAFTSGTTGRAKPTPLTHANVLASARSVLAAWRWQPDDVLVHALPMQHGHGLSGLHAALIAGSRTVVVPRFEPEVLVATIAAERASVLFCVPTMYERMLDAGVLSAAPMRSLRLAISGSAALPAHTSNAVTAALGQRPLERYGLTETGYIVSNLYDDRRAGEVGLPLPGAEVRIVGSDGLECDPGETGEIQTRGVQVFDGYATSVVADISPEGWFTTGDLGFLDSGSGYLTINGRSKELIVTGGLNVYPREVELVFEVLPSVKEIAVVGLPSSEWGEQVTAFIVLREGAVVEAGEFEQVASRNLAGYKRPKSYRLVDSLPRNHLGKVLRAELAAGSAPSSE